VSDRVVIVDDHVLFRSGLRAMLADHPEFEVVGEAEDARSGYDLIDATRPDLALIDMRLPGTDGISATRELMTRHPGLRVAILSAHDEPDLVIESLTAGARGYLLKTESLEQLLSGMRALARGETYVASGIAPETLEQLHRRQRSGKSSGGPIGMLSAREREVFGMLIAGRTNAAIAQELCISVKTVETHREHILRKLGCHSIVELMRFAARQSLLE
jgi:DNA-binding NarL/FixJ family response regulator